ncbi:flagellar assembly protein FliW [bacterium]|nr:flagellar assembly protein FliW [bacterium]
MPKFTTVRFGDLDYRQDDVIHLPEGLVGMPDLRNWLMLEMGDELPMKWFQSLDRGDFGFPVTQAYLFHDEYEFPVGEPTRRRLGNASLDDLATLIITTIHPGGDKVTGNLMAPLIVDSNTRRGAQLTLDTEDYSLRQEINYFKFGLAVGGESAENADTEQVSADTAAATGQEKPETVGV